MAEMEDQKDAKEAAKPAQKGPGKGDVAAFGIGCLVFVLFIVAIITVGILRE